MKIEKLQLSKQKKDINFQFYVLLKFITKLQASDAQEMLMTENIALLKSNPASLIESLKKYLSNPKGSLSILKKYAKDSLALMI